MGLRIVSKGKRERSWGPRDVEVCEVGEAERMGTSTFRDEVGKRWSSGV